MTATQLFENISKICPVAPYDTSDIITVIVDNHNLGKQFNENADGDIDKRAVVSISKAVACQFYVPDHLILENLLRIVSESPNAAVTNCGWTPVAIGTPFNLTSKKQLKKDSRNVEGIHNDSNGVVTFARLKIHAIPSTWQVLDRDMDQYTPAWAEALDFNDWVSKMDKILPGLANTRMLRTQSSSARVMDSKGEAVGGGNGHTWIKIADAKDSNRCRTAIIARALEYNLSWLKPKFSKKTGMRIASSHTTIVDQSVWSVGRLLFVGKPTATAPLSVNTQNFIHVDGDNEELDTSRAVISALNTFRVSKKLGQVVRISNNTSGFVLESDSLRMDTELELDDGRIVFVQDVIKELGKDGKLRCQAPFRESSSVAAFVALDGSGTPFVWDSGIDTKYVLPQRKTKYDDDFNALLGNLRTQLNAAIGEENAEAVLDVNALQFAWSRSFAIANNNKIGMLNKTDNSIELLATEAQSFGFRDSFGHFFNQLILTEVLAELSVDLNRRDTEALEKHVNGLETTPLMRMLKTRRQAKQASVKVDMFAQSGGITINDGIANITLPHRPFNVAERPPVNVIEKVVADYYAHFPEFGPFLEMLLHARFSPDRRRAFVWLHANSDFGKGFMTAIFSELGLLFDISSEGIESVISGKVVGLSPSAIFRCWILHVDEFKAASRELKQLNTNMQVSAKFQLQTKVDLFVKLFCSAEGVRSLSGGGVETQFNMRFSYVHPGDAALDSRPVFHEIGKHQYLLAMAAHVADYLNAGVERLVALGKVESSFIADTKVDKYQVTRRLAAEFGDIGDELRSIAKRIRGLFRRYENMMKTTNFDYRVSGFDLGISQSLFYSIKEHCKIGYVNVGGVAEPAIQLPNSAAFISAYINQPGADKSTAGKFAHKADEIAKLAHCLDNLDGHVGNVRVYQTNNLNGIHQRGKGLVVLMSVDYSDLDDRDAYDESLLLDPVIALKKVVAVAGSAIV